MNFEVCQVRKPFAHIQCLYTVSVLSDCNHVN